MQNNHMHHWISSAAIVYPNLFRTKGFYYDFQYSSLTYISELLTVPASSYSLWKVWDILILLEYFYFQLDFWRFCSENNIYISIRISNDPWEVIEKNKYDRYQIRNGSISIFHRNKYIFVPVSSRSMLKFCWSR